jgi:mitochondrial import receptor subunit TOM70
MGDPKGALEDLDEALKVLKESGEGELDRKKTVQVWVKKASVHMELGDPEEAFKDFDMAESTDPEDPDTYYHRGQGRYLSLLGVDIFP